MKGKDYDAIVTGEWEFRAKSKRMGVKLYEGFTPFQPQWVGRARWLAVLMEDSFFSLWLCRDEAGYKQLQDFYRNFEGVEPDLFLFKPEALFSGEWQVEDFTPKEET